MKNGFSHQVVSIALKLQERVKIGLSLKIFFLLTSLACLHASN